MPLSARVVCKWKTVSFMGIQDRFTLGQVLQYQGILGSRFQFEDLLMNGLRLFSVLGLPLFVSHAAWATAPREDGRPVQLKRLEALTPLTEEQYAVTPQLVLGVTGSVAKSLYFRYAPKVKINLNYPYAPLSRILATHAPGFSCYRRVAARGPEQYRCNIAFRPAEAGGTRLSVPPYTYELIPHFGDQKLQSLSLTLSSDADGDARLLMTEEQCPRLSASDFSGSNLPCAYQIEHDQVMDVYFPDDIFPQGVAVGWGVVVEPQH
jgi:hypothetical protein